LSPSVGGRSFASVAEAKDYAKRTGKRITKKKYKPVKKKRGK
jgi:hypothetical protein